ncbi:MAG: DUF3060 domain-containing protein [Myxococcota bacterium]
MFRNLLIVFGPIFGMILLLALMLPQDKARGERPFISISTGDDSHKVESDSEDEAFDSDKLAEALETAHRIRDVVHRVQEQSEEAVRRAEEEVEEAVVLAQEAQKAAHFVTDGEDTPNGAKPVLKAAEDDNDMTIVIDDDDFSFDFDFDQLPKWAAELGSGGVVLIAGNSQKTVRDCSKDTMVAVMGNSNTVTLRKKCKSVKIVGNSNVIKFSSAQQVVAMGNSNSVNGEKTGEIYVRGNGNSVRYEEGSPKLDEKGNGNDIRKVDDV